MSSSPQRHNGTAGLSLLEVLAAVMIFAMVMTVLIGTSSSAVHRVGISARQLEADLVADSLLADLEIEIKQGFAPEIEENEFTSEQYLIRMTMTELLSDDPGLGSPGGAVGAAANASGDIISLLNSALPEVAGHLRQYDIEVSWIEQNGPRSVTRTTFAFDWQAAQVELASLIEGAERSGVSGLGDDASDSQNGSDGLASSNTGSGAGRETPAARNTRLRNEAESSGRPPFNGRNARLNQIDRANANESNRWRPLPQ